jgi:hypothetical protein
MTDGERMIWAAAFVSLCVKGDPLTCEERNVSATEEAAAVVLAARSAYEYMHDHIAWSGLDCTDMLREMVGQEGEGK